MIWGIVFVTVSQANISLCPQELDEYELEGLLNPEEVDEESDNTMSSTSKEFKEGSWLLDQRSALQEGIGEGRALTNLVKSLIGTGILALPIAFKHAGLWTGLALTISICLLNLYCMHMLVYCAHYCGKRVGISQVDYATLTRLAFECTNNPKLGAMGPYFSWITNALIMINQLGFCCVYILFMAANIKQVVDEESPNNGFTLMDWMLVLFPFVVSLSMVRHLRLLAPAAMLANVLYLFGFIITFQYLFHHLPSTHSLPAFNSIATLPLFFGIVMFSFEGICVVLPIENRMHNPHRFVEWNGVLNVGCFFVIALYGSIGFFGYLRFGRNINAVITLNLPHIWYYQSVRIIISIAILVTYAVQFYVPLEIIEKKMIVPEDNSIKHNLMIYGVRVALVLLTFVLAVAIPHLDLFISLIGSLAGAGLALILPPIIDTLVMCSQNEHSTSTIIFVFIKNIIIGLIGFIGFIFGSYSAIHGIITAL